MAVALRHARTHRARIAGAAIRSELFEIVHSDVVVGEIVVRLDAPMDFARIHGHVGYRVFPAFQKRGFASAALRLLRELVRAPNRTLLFTCAASNLASSATLLRVGATLISRDPHKASDTCARDGGEDRLIFALDCFLSA